MELFIFIAFQLLMEVQSYKSPTIKVSPDVIRESSSVKISCETPADVRVNQCYFITNREEKNIKVRSSCELELTGAEVLRWAGVKSPVSIYINCYYTIHERGINKPSSDSPPATVTVLDLPQAKLRASASVILETDTVELSCENTEDLKMEKCYFSINGRESNSKVSSSCQLSLTGSQISVWPGGQSSSVRISCFYTVKLSQVQKPSAHSDPVTVTVQISTSTIKHTSTATTTSLTVMSTSETTTYSKTLDLHSETNLPTNTEKETISIHFICKHVSTSISTQTQTSQLDTVISTSETPVYRTTVAHTKGPPSLTYKDLWFIVLVFIGVAVILSGLMGLICLCRFASKKRRKHQGIGMSCSGPAEAYSLITSVPATSQPIYEDVLVSKQQKQGNPEENENVYHLYSTIPDKPVHSNTGDQVYSLVKMH
ncbi:uncharacterized protein LOC107685992 [Sinocyclocheilus anshuiensis]|uniref:uncharacterized protein LOC107685992 n=1 Tax=Sinocyclocheilus anshuiensis TaxID=1608454 RepID=UPI0007B7A1E6|nr:PREDICTED: uncharacterized protein LOC107685992 [Sinocyclocheilus anshuiensis]